MHPTDDLVGRGMTAIAKAASPTPDEPARPLTADEVRAIVQDVFRSELAHALANLRSRPEPEFRLVACAAPYDASGNAMILGEVRRAPAYRSTR